MFLTLFLTAWLFMSSVAIERHYHMRDNSTRPYYHIEKAEEYFKEFIITHQKNYEYEERQTRFDIFKENLIHINHLNIFSGSVHGVTRFTDLTQEEFSEQYNSCVFLPEESLRQYSYCRVITDADLTTKLAPPTLDYRQLNAVTSIKDQGRCGICWAFATTGSLEGLYAMKYRQLLSLSEQQLMDCLPSSRHCRGGNFMTSALSDLMYTAGVESESDYPYVARDLPCQSQQAKARVRVTGCLNFQLQSEDKLREALVKYGPIAIAVNASPLQNHFEGILDARTCPPGIVGHAVLLIGYGTEYGRDYWIIKNSWGTAWGPEHGYVRFARGQNVCGMLNGYAAAGMIA